MWRLHRWIYGLSNGRIGSSMGGHKILKLTAKGRKSGQPRSIVIWYFPCGDSYVIVGSNAGADWHPAWYLNLEADPGAEIQIGRERLPVTARTAEGEEREQLWTMVTEADSIYSDYQAQTERQVPIVVLDPVE